MEQFFFITMAIIINRIPRSNFQNIVIPKHVHRVPRYEPGADLIRSYTTSTMITLFHQKRVYRLTSGYQELYWDGRSTNPGWLDRWLKFPGERRYR